MDRTDQTPVRYWVMRPFAHYATVLPDLPAPAELTCGICGDVVVRAADLPPDGDLPMPMWQDAPICARHATEKVADHPITPTYMRWLEEGDPRWWSPWFCDCDSCDPVLQEARTQ